MFQSVCRFCVLSWRADVAVLLVACALGAAAEAGAETPPTAMFSLLPETIGETGSTVLTVTVSPPPVSRFDLEVELVDPAYLGGGPSGRAGFLDSADDARIRLEFAAGETVKQATIRATANDGVLWYANEATDNYVVGGMAELWVRGTVAGGSGVTPPEPVMLAIRDDDTAGGYASGRHCRDGSRPVAEHDGGSWVVGDRVELVFDRDLQTGRTPTAVHFRILEEGRRRSEPRAARVVVGYETDETTPNPRKVQVDLERPVEYGPAIRVWYRPPTDSNGDIDRSAGALQDPDGNVACHMIGIVLDNRTPPRVELVLTPNPIPEDGGMSAVTARLAKASDTAFEVELSVAAVPPAGPGAFRLSANRTLRFEAGAIESTGSVTIAAVDDEDRGPARKRVTVSGTIANPPDDVRPPEIATLVIVDDESSLLADGGLEAHVLRPWLARFGRAAASHAMEAVGGRLHRQPRGPAASVVGLPVAPAAAMPSRRREDPPFARRRQAARSVPGTESALALLERSAFFLPFGTGGKDRAGSEAEGAVWGRGAVARFEGREGPVSLDGHVHSFAVGMDGAWEGARVGFALAHTIGDGSYDVGGPCFGPGCRGGLESRITAIHPYFRIGRGDGLSAWGMLGYGRGHTVLTERETGVRRRAPIAMRMGAFGTRRTLLPAEEGQGFELALRSDALFMGIDSSQTAALAGTDGDVRRLRLALAADRRLPLDEARALALSLSAGLRHDSGDADHGAGVEWSAETRYIDRRLGLTANGAVHGLALHRDDGFEEWGASGSLRLDPGTSGRGLTMAVAPAWGAGPGTEGGHSRLLEAPGIAGRAAGRRPARLDTEVGYGFAAPGGRAVHFPYAGASLASAAAGLRIGWRVDAGPGAWVGIEGTRHGRRARGYGVALHAGLRW